MSKVVGVKFKNSNRIFYFLLDDIDVKKGEKVIVDTERGLQLGIITTNEIDTSNEKIEKVLKKIVRLATIDDINRQEENEKTAVEALENAKKIAKKLNLNMNFIDCNFTLDKNQLIYNFVSDERVDFRELAKKLASIYKTRIELRQIGVRDKAKEIGGIGPCGRQLCCNCFLNDFNSVSINMAKNQYLALNPTKINGICGRLLCCLKYEDDNYLEMKKDFPPIGAKIKVDGIEGKVISHNLFKNTYILKKKDKTTIELENKRNDSNK